MIEFADKVPEKESVTKPVSEALFDAAYGASGALNRESGGWGNGGKLDNSEKSGTPEATPEQRLTPTEKEGSELKDALPSSNDSGKSNQEFLEFPDIF